jgi:hypothetical protein
MDVFLSFIFIFRIPVELLKKVTNDRKRSETDLKQELSGTVNGLKRLGTFESERSNALERIVENGLDSFTVLSRSRFKNERNTVLF